MAQASQLDRHPPRANHSALRRDWPAFRIDLLVAFLLFALVLGLYLSDRSVVQRSDSLWTLHVSLSLLREGNLDLNEYAAVISAADYRVIEVNGDLLSYFPPGAPLLVTPILALIVPLLARVRGVDFYQDVLLDPDPFVGLASDVETALACLLAALAAPAIYAIGRLTLNRSRAALVTLLFAFGSAVWSTASRGLWQHGPSILMLSLALYLVLRARRDPQWIQWAGLPLAIAFVCRPTNAIPIVLITFYVLLHHSRFFVRYALYAAIVAILFVWFSLDMYDSIVPPYYLPQRIGGHARFWEGVAGNLISPARGLLIYSPIFLLCGYGVWIRLRARGFDRLDGVVVGVITCHWMLIAAFPHWWGGVSYGPRFFADMTPFLVYLLIPVVAQLDGRQHMALTALFTVLLTVSVWMHYRGATQWATWQWNDATPGVAKSVDEDPSRVWNWKDPPFLRGLGWRD